MEELVFYSIKELREYLNTVPKDVSVKITITSDVEAEDVVAEKIAVDEALDGTKEAAKAPGGGMQ